MQLGHVIAKLRAEKKISQRQLAKDLNVSAGVIGMWETNKRLPSLDTFILIIDYFGVSADFLLENDRKLKSTQYSSSIADMSSETRKILDTFEALTEDNKDILIGEAKKMLKQQRLEEKRAVSIQKAT